MKNISELKEWFVKAMKLKIKPQDIKDEEPIFTDGLGLDSVDAVVLACELEQEFNVRIERVEDSKMAFASIKSLAAYIEKGKNQ